MNTGEVSPVSNNRDEIVWEESKKPPIEELNDLVDSLSDKIDEYIEQKVLREAAVLVYSAKARVYGSTIFIHFDGLDIRFELKDLLDQALREYDDAHHPEDKQADIDDLLPLLRGYIKELEDRQKALESNAN